MARNTEIVEGKHLIKPSPYAGRVMLTIPKKLAEDAGINGDGFVGAMVVGKCVVIAPVSRTNPDEFNSELGKIFERAIEAWEKEKAL